MRQSLGSECDAPLCCLSPLLTYLLLLLISPRGRRRRRIAVKELTGLSVTIKLF